MRSRVLVTVALSTSAALLTACGASGPARPEAGGSTTGTVASRAVEDPADDRRGDGWRTARPETLGLRPARLRTLAGQARRLDSTCYAVVRKGRLVGEWSWGTSRTTPREVFSITKSITSALVGIAVRDGDLRLDDRVSRYVPQWRGTPSAEVTVRHLLSNDSGRFWSAESDYGRLLRSRNRTAYAVGLSQQHEPGTAWAYNNAAIQVLEPVLEAATGMAVEDFAQDRLFGPLGMTHSRFVTDASGSAMVFYGVQTTCLDLARFGMLYLGGGAVDGTRVLARDYVHRSVGRPSTVHNAAYGYLWWLNRPGRLRGATDPVDAAGQPVSSQTGQLAPGAPADLVAAVGFGGQVLMVDRRSRTIVVRLGVPPAAGDQAYDVATAAQVVTTAQR